MPITTIQNSSPLHKPIINELYDNFTNYAATTLRMNRLFSLNTGLKLTVPVSDLSQESRLNYLQVYGIKNPKDRIAMLLDIDITIEKIKGLLKNEGVVIITPINGAGQYSNINRFSLSFIKNTELG